MEGERITGISITDFDVMKPELNLRVRVGSLAVSVVPPSLGHELKDTKSLR